MDPNSCMGDFVPFDCLKVYKSDFKSVASLSGNDFILWTELSFKQ